MSGELREIRVVITTRDVDHTGIYADDVVSIVTHIVSEALRKEKAMLSYFLACEADVV